MKRRILTVFLIVCLLLTIPVYALETQEYRTNLVTDGLIMQIAASAGIEIAGFDGETVTRGEFVQLLVELLTKGEIEAEDCSFEDVTAGSRLSYSLHYAQAAGIVSEASSFNPDDVLNQTEAVKMAVCALGYRIRAELKGGYPRGYIYIAKEISISDGLSGVTDQPITAQEAYLLLNNTLCTNFYSIYAVDSNTINYNISDESILSAVYDIECVEGIVVANEHTSLTDPEGGVEKDRIRVGTQELFYDGEQDYLGYRVKAYVQDLGGKNECLYMQPYRSKVVVFSGREYEQTEGRTVILSSDGQTTRYTLDDSVTYIHNKKAITEEAVTALPTGEEYTVRMIDSNLDGAYDCVIISQYQYCLVQSIDTYHGIVSDENGAAGTIRLPQESAYNIYGTYRGERVSSISDLQEGMLLAAVVSSDGSAADIFVCDDARSVSIASLFSEECIFTDAEGVDYQYGAYFKEYYEEDVSFNTAAVIYFGMNGEAVVGRFTSVGSQFGWVVAQNTENNLLRNVQLKIYTENGKMEIFDVDEDVKIDGKRTNTTIESIVNAMSDSNRLIRYTTNTEGKIKNIDIAQTYTVGLDFPDYSDDMDALTLFFDGSNQTLQYKSSAGSFVDKFNVRNATVFSVPTNLEDRNDDSAYRIVTGGLVEDKYYNVMAYNLNEALEAEVIVIFENNADISEVNTNGVVVQEVYRTIDANGTECYGVSVYNNGEYQYLYSSEFTENVVAELKKGDIVRLRLDGESIVGIVREYSYEENRVFGNYGAGTRIDWLQGLVYDISGSSLSIIENVRDLQQAVSFEQLKSINIPSSVSYIYLRTRDDGTVESAVVRPTLQQNINGAKTAGNDANFAVAQRRYYSAERLFIYIVD